MSKKQKKFDKDKIIKELARERVGIVPSTKIFKTKKKNKYPNQDEELNEN